MDHEPGAELGQQQVPAMPAGPTSLPEDAPVGEPRRPSRSRRLLIAGVVLAGVSLVVSVGVLLSSGQLPSGARVTTTAPGAVQTTSPVGSAEASSKDFGRVPRGGLLDRFDVSVFLVHRIDPVQQDMIRRRIAALPVVEAFAYESQAEAFQQFRVMYRHRPDLLRGATEQIMPTSFRVVLHDPSQFGVLVKGLCPPSPGGTPECVEGVDQVTDQHWINWASLAGPWLHTTDAMVVLAPGVDPDRRRAIRAVLEALPVVEHVDFESRAAARRRLRQADLIGPLALHDFALDSFRVRLSVPTRFAELYDRLCSGRWSFTTTPVCKPGVRVVIANPLSVYNGLPR